MIRKFFIFLTALLLGIFFSHIVKYKNNLVENNRNYSESSEFQNDSELIEVLKEIENSHQHHIAEFKNERFGVAGVDDDKEIKDLYLKFQKAVAEDDRKMVSTLLEYPFRAYFSNDVGRIKYRFINNRKEFLKAYDRIFDEKLKNFITKIDVENEEDIWARYDGIAVGRGVIWIGVFCNDNLCRNGNYIKIRTIHGSISLKEEE